MSQNTQVSGQQGAGARRIRGIMRGWIFLMGCLLVTGAASTLRAGDIQWDTGGGGDTDWSTPANWTGDTEPTSADNAYVGSASADPASAVITESNEACAELYVGSISYPAKYQGEVQMNPTGGLAAGHLYLDGKTSSFLQHGGALSTTETQVRFGSFRQFGGAHNVTGTLNVASNNAFSGSTGTYELHDGQLSTNQTRIGYGALGPAGSFLQTGGTHTITRGLIVGGDSGTGTYRLEDGILSVGEDETIGITSVYPNTFTQTGGIHQIGGDLAVGRDVGGRGDYAFEAGNLSVNGNLLIGSGIFPSTKGTMVQTGGNIRVGGTLDVGYSTTNGVPPSTTGTYNLHGGSLTMARGDSSSIRLGRRHGTATLTLGDATHTPTITETGTGAGSNFLVRANDDTDSTVVVRGCGTVGLTGTLTNNAQVIADGYGTDRALDLSTFAAVTNAIENTTGNGWFAVNKGKLVLPDLAIPTGTSAINWGEDPADAQIDLVNSVRVNLTDVQADGHLAIALLAPDRSELDIPGAYQFIDIWKFTPTSLQFASMDLLFRYDNILAGQTGLAEPDLKLFRSTDGISWTPVAGSVDLTNHTLLAAGLTEFSYYSVGVPEPGTVGFVVLSIGWWFGRRGRSR